LQQTYAPRKLVVLAVNLWQSWSIIESYQNMYPDLLMLRDSGSVWSDYVQNSYIPLNYVITPEQTVDYFMEGYNQAVIQNHILNLLPDVTIVLTPEAESVPQGGVLTFDATLTNWEGATESIYALTQVTLPGGQTVTLLGPIPVTVDPYETISVDLHHDIPLGAPLGSYQYIGKIGTYPPVDLMDSSKFDFEVVAP
jgi:signal peptidase I